MKKLTVLILTVAMIALLSQMSFSQNVQTVNVTVSAINKVALSTSAVSGTITAPGTITLTIGTATAGNPTITGAADNSTILRLCSKYWCDNR